MKSQLIFCLAIFFVTNTYSQVGIGTVSPNSTLDVRGSYAGSYRSFAASTAASSTDYTLVFTGAAASAVTLPDATTCAGRMYIIKNASATAPLLTVNTTSSQTIDGVATWSLDVAFESVILVSNGANWQVSAQTASASLGTAWSLGGNNTVALQKMGTISNFDIPFITNNTEKMRLSATGNLAVGVSAFNVTYPEKFLVDAGTTSSVNAIVGKGNINNYLQLNIQNINAGINASSDVVATADNGSETTNYVDMGINSSVNTQGIMGLANDAYLYNIGQNFLIGTGTAAKSLVFMTGGTTQTTNERMRIDGTGKTGIGTTTPSEKLDVSGNFRLSGAFMPGNSAGVAGTFLTSTGAGSPPVWIDPSPYLEGIAWELGGNNVPSVQTIGPTSNFDLPFITNNTEKMRLTASGNLGLGTSTFTPTFSEKLLVDDGSTGNANYQNVIVGKGNTNSYAQLNIQNNSAGTGASADVVATANDGNESINFVDMGINGGGNTSTGVLGGANTAYLYATGNDFAIGNSTNNKNLIFFTTSANVQTERARMTTAGLMPGADNAYTLGATGIRWSALWSANGTIQTSDSRLKTNIHPLAYGLKDVMKMQPVSYQWKDNATMQKIGLIAQEVKAIVPEVVIGDEKKEMLGMNYGELVPVLINAIKEQQQQIEDMKKQMDDMKKELNKLKKS